MACNSIMSKGAFIAFSQILIKIPQNVEGNKALP